MLTCSLGNVQLTPILRLVQHRATALESGSAHAQAGLRKPAAQAGRGCKNEIPGATRVAHRVGRFVAIDHRRRGQLCTFGNTPGVHLKLGGMLFKQPGPLLLSVASPSDRQLEKHIKQCAVDSAHVVFTDHARQRMRQRYINDPMVLDVLRNGVMAPEPEPDMKHTGVKCRMQRFVSGVQVAVVVYVEYPATDLVIVTVIDVKKD